MRQTAPFSKGEVCLGDEPARVCSQRCGRWSGRSALYSGARARRTKVKAGARLHSGRLIDRLPDDRGSGVTVAQQFARRSSRATSFVPGHLAIYEDRLIAAGVLHAAPLTTGEVMSDLTHPVRLHAETVQIVDDHVSGLAFAQRPAIAEPGRVRRKSGESIVRFLQGNALLVADQPAEKVGRVGTAVEELGVGAPV